MKINYNDPKSLECSKTILRGDIITVQEYITEQDKYQIKNITLHLKELGKQNKNQASRKKKNKD